MEEQRFQVLVKALEEQEGVEEIFLLNSDGEVVYKSRDFQLSNDESTAILTAASELYLGCQFGKVTPYMVGINIDVGFRLLS